MSETLITPDFSDVKDQVEPGTYKVRVVNSEVGQWEGKNGKPDTVFVKWELDTFDEAEPKNNGRKIWHRTPINGGGAFRLQEFYKAAMKADCPKEGFDREALLGQELEITVVDGVDRRTKEPTGYTEVKTCKPL